jgi:hypothetical protein
VISNSASFILASLAILSIGAALAETTAEPSTEMSQITACKATALLAMKERSPTLKDIVFDMDSLTVSHADTKIEDIPIKAIIMGEATFERQETGAPQHFLCLIGEKGKVLLTFFTTR